jgi:hypothetical protein
LADREWAGHVSESDDVDAVVREIVRIGDLLGTRTVGRAGALEEVVPRLSSLYFGAAAKEGSREKKTKSRK